MPDNCFDRADVLSNILLAFGLLPLWAVGLRAEGMQLLTGLHPPKTYGGRWTTAAELECCNEIFHMSNARVY